MAGETDFTLLLNTPMLMSKSAGELVAQAWNVEVLDTMLESDDLTAIGRVPKGANVIGFGIQTDDLDTDDSVALVWDIILGDVSFYAGLANDTAKSGTIIVGNSGTLTVTTDTIVYAKAATAAATAASGTFNLVALYTTTE